MDSGGPAEPQADMLPVGLPVGLREQRGMTRIELPYPCELGHGWVDQLSISPQLAVHQTVVRPSPYRKNNRLQVDECRPDFAEAALSVHALQQGTLLGRELQAPLVMRPGQDLFRYSERGAIVSLLDTSSDLVMTALMCSDRELHALIGEDAGQQLLADLGLADSPKTKVVHIPLHVSEPLRQCLSSGSSGALHTLYAQSKILEYLWKLTTFTSAAKVVTRPGPGGVGTLRALHDYLMHLEGETPTLKELGHKFGTSPQSLNRGFIREYGQSIFAMVSNYRLQLAHRALLEGNLPIKTIVTHTGYSHANHFTHAFSAKFGYTPGSLRRKPQALE